MQEQPPSGGRSSRGPQEERGSRSTPFPSTGWVPFMAVESPTIFGCSLFVCYSLVLQQV